MTNTSRPASQGFLLTVAADDSEDAGARLSEKDLASSISDRLEDNLRVDSL